MIAHSSPIPPKVKSEYIIIVKKNTVKSSYRRSALNRHRHSHHNISWSPGLSPSAESVLLWLSSTRLLFHFANSSAALRTEGIRPRLLRSCQSVYLGFPLLLVSLPFPPRQHHRVPHVCGRAVQLPLLGVVVVQVVHQSLAGGFAV